MALLLQYLAYFGNAVGRGPHYMVENDQHYPNLFVLLAGETAKARKGLSAGRIRHIFDTADPDWARDCITGGMSSGEGILHAIRDPVYTMKKGVSVMTDPGIEDKRLLLDEREFYSALEVMKREGNILSRIVRDAWDCRPVLRTLTKNTHTRVTNGFISIVGHITIEELRQKLDHTSMANGYANRFLFACVHRSKMLPFGGDALDATDLGMRTRVAIETARNFDRVNMTAAAMELWVAVYPQLSGEVQGLMGALTARAEGQTIRSSADLRAVGRWRRHRPRSPRGRACGLGVLRRLHALHLRRRHRGHHCRCHPARAAQRRRDRQDADRDLYAVQQQSPQRGYRPGAGIADAARQGAVSYHTATTRPAWAADRDLVRDLREIQPAINTH